MNKLPLKIAMVATSAALITLGMSTKAEAILIGDSVQGQFDYRDVSNIEITEVDDEIEFFGEIEGSLVSADIGDDFIEIELLNLVPAGEIESFGWTFSDLDWVNGPGFITDVQLVSGDADAISSLAFEDDAIRILFREGFAPDPDQRLTAWQFEITAEHIPTPAAVLPTLFGMGTAAFRKRRKQNSEV